MTSKLDEIKAAVEGHKLAKAAHREALERIKRVGYVTFEDRVADDSYESRQDTAIAMIEALLPVVEAAERYRQDGGYEPMADLFDALKLLD